MLNSRKTTPAIPRPKGSSQCPHHKENEVTFVCESCNGILACGKCVTSIHRQHRLVGLNEVIPQKKVKIQSFIDKAQQTELSKLQQELKYADSKFHANQEKFKKIIQEIRIHGEKLKSAIDTVVDNYVIQCQHLERENQIALGRFKQEVQTLYIDMNIKLQECKQTLNSGTDIEIYDTAKAVNRLQLPTEPTLRHAIFSPVTSSRDQVVQLLGTLYTKQERETSTPTRQRSRSKKRTSERSLQRQFSDATNEISHFNHDCYIDSMVATPTGEHWMVECWSKEVVLVNDKGIKQVKIPLDTEVHDISVSPQTGKLWMCTEEDVREITRGGARTHSRIMFPTNEDITLSIFVTSDNKVVLGSDMKVAVFKSNGEKLHETDPGIIAFPRHIAVCPVTSNVAVVDWDRNKSGGKDKPHIKVLSPKMELLYRYERQIDSWNSQNYPEFTSYKFDPYDVCYDAKGQLLIADSVNHAILLLDPRGKFLKIVHTDDHPPTSMSLFSNKILWVGFGNIRKTIRLLKYSE